MATKKKTVSDSNNKKTFSVGDRVRLLKNTRHNMIFAGAIGHVIEVNDMGVGVEFMKKPHPVVARSFNLDPDAEQPYNCLFPTATASRSLTVVAANDE